MGKRKEKAKSRKKSKPPKKRETKKGKAKPPKQPRRKKTASAPAAVAEQERPSTAEQPPGATRGPAVSAAIAEEKPPPAEKKEPTRGAEAAALAPAPPVREEQEPPRRERKPRRDKTAIISVAPEKELIARARARAEDNPAAALAAYAELARTGSLSKETALDAAELARREGDAELAPEFLVQASLADPADEELGRTAYETARAAGEPWAAWRALKKGLDSGSSEALRLRRELVAGAVEEALDLLLLADVGLARGRELNRARKVFSLLLDEALSKVYLSVEGASSVFMLEGQSRYRASSRDGEVLVVEDTKAGATRLSFRCRGAGTRERATRQAGSLLCELAEALFSGADATRRAGGGLAAKISEALGRRLEFSQYWPLPDGTLQIILRTDSGGFETLTLTESGANIEDSSGKVEEFPVETAGAELARARERYVMIAEGLEKLDAGATEEAEACACRALELDPLGAEPNLLMGRVHSARAEWDRAAERLRQAADADADSAVILNELGLALTRARRYWEAANSLSAAFDLDMRDEYRANLIEAWMLSGEVARAEKELERLRRKVNEQPDALAQLGHIQLHSDAEKAERLLRRALALDKTCGLAYVGLARIACREKAVDEAVYYVTRALASKKPDALPRLRAEPDLEPLRASGKLDELLSGR